MDLSIIMPWVGAALSIIALGTQIKAIISSGERKLEERVSKVEVKLIEHDRRVQAVENEMKHLPDRETVHKLQIDLTEMKGQMATMVKSSEATERATRRVEDFLLKKV
jgi:phage shock protein A